MTDGTGQYKIVSLLPGIYTVTFTLQGFSTFKRDGIEVTGSSDDRVNGGHEGRARVAETITVTGETPLVDVQSATVQKVVTKEVIDAIPTGRLGHQSGGASARHDSRGDERHGRAQATRTRWTSQDVGGTAGDTFTDLAIHGSKASEQRQTIGGALGGDDHPVRRIAQLVAELHRDAGDVGRQVGRRRLARRRRRADELHPARWRQHLQGAVLLHRREQLDAGDQLHDDRRRSGDQPPGPRPADAARALDKVYDFNPGYGGPIKKDKVWWFATARWTAAKNTVTQNYPNKNFMSAVTVRSRSTTRR